MKIDLSPKVRILKKGKAYHVQFRQCFFWQDAYMYNTMARELNFPTFDTEISDPALAQRELKRFCKMIMHKKEAKVKSVVTKMSAKEVVFLDNL